MTLNDTITRTTQLPDFKVTPLFNTEHLRNGHDYNEILRPCQGNDLE